MLGGDIILEVEGIPVGTIESYLRLRQHLSQIEKDHTVTVKVLRHGRVIERNRNEASRYSSEWILLWP